VARIAALVLLVLGLLPVANWIPGGHEAPWYRDRIDLWLSGGAILGGAAVILWMAFRRHPALWREGGWQRLAERWHRAGWQGDGVIALVAMLVYLLVGQTILSGRPLLIDEIIQVWQARVFASGRLWVPTPESPEFTAAMHLVDLEGRRFGQFPAGGPAMLMLGSFLRVEWLIGPLFGAIGVLAFARILRRIEAARGVALAAVLLLATSPFWAFLSGSMMNHVTASAWLLVAAAALARATSGQDADRFAALFTGLALGIAATIRPMDGVAFALPAGAWLLWRARLGTPHLVALCWSALGITLPIVALLAVNDAQTGEPLLFGYVALWGPSHELGFHDTPWGVPHTISTGIELLNLYFLRLQSHFLETPAPALLFATVALLFVKGLRPFDRWAISGCALLSLAYFAYWHDGYYLGPRFLLPLTPWIALWTARAPGILGARFRNVLVPRVVTSVGVFALALSATQLIPLRASQYRNGMSNLRSDLDSLLSANHVVEGTVLVRESFGAQLLARMWGAGVQRTDAETIYRTTDSCVLEEALDRAERSGHRDARTLELMLAPARADSARLRALNPAPDTTLRVLPGSTWRDRCISRVRDDIDGFALFAPTMLLRPTNVLVVRDLHRRPPNALPPYYLLSRDGTSVESAFRVVPLDADSLERAWEVP
jgi:hypothetical protein